MTDDNELGLITLEEGAELLREGIVTFKKKLDDGKIPAIQISDKIRKVRKQDVIDYVNNQAKKPEASNSNDISKFNEQIEITKKKQELEALNAGFKTSDNFINAFETLKTEKDKLEQSRKKLEIDTRAFEMVKLQGEADIAQGKSKNAEDKERILGLGKEYKKKWQLEDERRKNESKLVVSHLDELGKTIYNTHPCYMGVMAKERLAKDFEPIATHFGISPVFNKKGEYLSLSIRLSVSNLSEITNQRKEENNIDDMVSNINKAYDVLLQFYKWVEQQGNYEFISWIYKEIKTLNGMITGKSQEELETSINFLMERFGIINKGLVELATRYDKSNHPNQVSDSGAVEYILKVSDEIERLLGIKSGDE